MIIDFNNLNIWQWIILGLQVFSFVVGIALIGKERKAEIRKWWEPLVTLIVMVLVLLAFGVIK